MYSQVMKTLISTKTLVYWLENWLNSRYFSYFTGPNLKFLKSLLKVDLTKMLFEHELGLFTI